jgi:hypothetical protein
MSDIFIRQWQAVTVVVVWLRAASYRRAISVSHNNQTTFIIH